MNSSWDPIISIGIMFPTNLSLQYIIRLLYTGLFFTSCNFSPFTLARSFDHSEITKTQFCLNRDNLRPLTPTHESGENKIGPIISVFV